MSLSDLRERSAAYSGGQVDHWLEEFPTKYRTRALTDTHGIHIWVLGPKGQHAKVLFIQYAGGKPPVVGIVSYDWPDKETIVVNQAMFIADWKQVIPLDAPPKRRKR